MMLRSLDIRRFRGFKDLKVDDLGRVNLIIGRNDVGKTSLMMAAALAATGPDQLAALIALGIGVPVGDIESWSTLFPFGDLDVGIEIAGRSEAGTFGWTFRRTSGAEAASDDGTSLFSAELLDADGTSRALHVAPTGALLDVDGKVVRSGRTPEWADHTAESFAGAVRAFQSIVLAGREDEVTRHVSKVSPDLVGLDLVGQKVWVRLSGTKRRLPISVLGDGARWMFDLAVAMSTERGHIALFCDEVDAGMHYSAMPPMWRMIREGTPERQTFATTHSDDCIRAACQVFTDAGDDGLRIIRLDRTETGHRAVSYTAADALYAIDNGWEIRG